MNSTGVTVPVFGRTLLGGQVACRSHLDLSGALDRHHAPLGFLLAFGQHLLDRDRRSIGVERNDLRLGRGRHERQRSLRRIGQREFGHDGLIVAVVGTPGECQRNPSERRNQKFHLFHNLTNIKIGL